MDARPDLPFWLIDVQEAFWLLMHSTAMTGGGMTGLHLEPPRTADVIAMAEAYGFDPVYFLRVIGPSVALYRQAVTARLQKQAR